MDIYRHTTRCRVPVRQPPHENIIKNQVDTYLIENHG